MLRVRLNVTAAGTRPRPGLRRVADTIAHNRGARVPRRRPWSVVLAHEPKPTPLSVLNCLSACAPCPACTTCLSDRHPACAACLAPPARAGARRCGPCRRPARGPAAARRSTGREGRPGGRERAGVTPARRVGPALLPALSSCSTPDACSARRNGARAQKWSAARHSAHNRAQSRTIAVLARPADGSQAGSGILRSTTCSTRPAAGADRDAATAASRASRPPPGTRFVCAAPRPRQRQ
jgi:hypothetical protein